ncbi:MAG: hypothetical protein IPL79_01215 [Myxococcales bacterium]|nr:hypothetical protein [Myxococcales bacterium]
MNRNRSFVLPWLLALAFVASCSNKKAATDPTLATPEECEGTTESPEVGKACETADDCPEPLFCHLTGGAGKCAAPDDPALLCNSDGSCEDADQICSPTGYCVSANDACETHDDCSTGFECSGNGNTTCTPSAAACPDRDEPLNLRGAWKVESLLHLREAIGNTGDAIGDVAEILRDIKDGTVEGSQLEGIGLGSVEAATLAALINGLAPGVIDQYVSDDILLVADVLATINDVLNDMNVTMTVAIGGKHCAYTYRGTATWDSINFMLNGQPYTFLPSSTPAVGVIESEEFGVLHACGKTYFDRHRYYNLIAKIPSALVDFAIAALTDYDTAEDALSGVINCEGLASNAGDPVLEALALAACEQMVTSLVDYVKDKLDSIADDLSVVALRGYSTPEGSTKLEDGHWLGSLIVKKAIFPGEFTGEKLEQ